MIIPQMYQEDDYTPKYVSLESTQKK